MPDGNGKGQKNADMKTGYGRGCSVLAFTICISTQAFAASQKHAEPPGVLRYIQSAE